MFGRFWIGLFKVLNKTKQETLNVVTIAMICSTLASLWKSQYFQRPIYNPVEDLWWSLYCENMLIKLRKAVKYIHKKATSYMFAWALNTPFLFEYSSNVLFFKRAFHYKVPEICSVLFSKSTSFRPLIHQTYWTFN